MKKYVMYVPILLLILCSIISISVFSKRNDFTYRWVSRNEDTPNENLDAIEDLKYHFTVYENTQYWDMKGVGNTFYSTYKRGYLFDNEQHKFQIYLKTIPNEETKKIMQQQGPVEEGRLASTSSVNYEMYINDKGNKKLVHKTSVKVKNSLDCFQIRESYMYGDRQYDAVFTSQDNNVYFDDINPSTEMIGHVAPNGNTYFYISPRMYNINKSKVEFSSDPTGIYMMNKQKQIKRIHAFDMKREDILDMILYKDKLALIVLKNNTLFLSLYDNDGKLLDEIKLKEKIDDWKVVKLHLAGDKLVSDVLKHAGVHEELKVFEIQDKTLKQIDSFVYRQTSNDIIKSFKYENQRLYILSKKLGDWINQEGSICLEILEKDKVLYDGLLQGSFLEDKVFDNSGYNGDQRSYANMNNTIRQVVFLDFD